MRRAHPWPVVFREGGGMPPISLAPRSARYLSFAARSRDREA